MRRKTLPTGVGAILNTHKGTGHKNKSRISEVLLIPNSKLYTVSNTSGYLSFDHIFVAKIDTDSRVPYHFWVKINEKIIQIQ